MPRRQKRRDAPRPRGTSSSHALGGRRSGPELVFALVGALGTDLDRVGSELETELKRVRYAPYLIRLSELLHGFDRWRDLPSFPLDEQIESHQKAGNELRKVTGYPDAMAVLATAAIQDHRNGAQGGSQTPTAYLLRSLKRPEEVDTLRRVYGPSLFVIAVHAPLETRIEVLAEKIARTRSKLVSPKFVDRANELIERDAEELGTKYGQNLRMTFPEADVIIDATEEGQIPRQIQRFIRIVFSHPFETPHVEEIAMFHAKAAALCSADLGRQVGAVIANDVGDILASGTNEVPRFGGGHYWPGDGGDARDFARPTVDSQRRRKKMLQEVLESLDREGWLDSKRLGRFRGGITSLTEELSITFKDTRLMNVGEFGRPVHAEMSALLDAARRGVSVKDADLYTTTFPCHNCAKHIVAAGIKRVRFIEPYPESLADELHDDSIVVDPVQRDRDSGRLCFETFVGVAPRRFIESFSMVKRKDSSGKPLEWDPAAAQPRLPAAPPQLPGLAEGAVLDAFERILLEKRLVPQEARTEKGPATRRRKSGSKARSERSS
jgi:deoxycytidylate deaminase